MNPEKTIRRLSDMLVARADRVAGGNLTERHPLEFIFRGEAVSARVYQRYNGTFVLALDVYVDDVDELDEIFRWVATRSGVMPFATIRVDRPLVRGSAPSAVKISHALVAEDVSERQIDEVLDAMTYMSRRARHRISEIVIGSDDDDDDGEPVEAENAEPRPVSSPATQPAPSTRSRRPSRPKVDNSPPVDGDEDDGDDDDPGETIDGDVDFGEVPVEPSRRRERDAILAELDDLIGLDPVKEEIGRLVAAQRAAAARRERGLAGNETSPHLVFVGNPGTGKTTVARLLGELYRSIGLLPKGHLVEADRSTLVAAYLGQTAIKTRAVCERALGGVLFIDEAYSLVGERDQYGEECINTLLSFMENHRGQLAVVVAGYPYEMLQFIESNPGLRARFDLTIVFPDYSNEELEQIFLGIARKSDYEITPSALERVRRFIAAWPRQRGFGNGREVRKLFGDIARRHSDLLFGGGDKMSVTTQQLKTIDVDAVPLPPEYRSSGPLEGDGGYL